jgi:hypothetical protein
MRYSNHTQYPGGLTRCDTLVHFGSSAEPSAQSAANAYPMKLTVYPFPVFLLLAIEKCVFVFRQHLLLNGHLLLPPLHSLCRNIHLS